MSRSGCWERTARRSELIELVHDRVFYVVYGEWGVSEVLDDTSRSRVTSEEAVARVEAIGRVAADSSRLKVRVLRRFRVAPAGLAQRLGLRAIERCHRLWFDGLGSNGSLLRRDLRLGSRWCRLWCRS